MSTRRGYLALAGGWLGVAVGLAGLIARSGSRTSQPLIIAAAFFPYLAGVGLVGGVLLAACRAWAGAGLPAAHLDGRDAPAARDIGPCSQCGRTGHRQRRLQRHAGFRATTWMLGHGYHDAAEQAGAGFLPTYPTDRMIPPVLALDHIVTRNATATDVSTLALAGSDHRGLLAALHLSAPAR